jgi:nucleoside-diphosphate-sugar epimerase
MTTVAVIGASGFVGGAVAKALRARGVQVVTPVAPRVETATRSVVSLRGDLDRPEIAESRAAMRRALSGCDAVVNAAGIAEARSSCSDALIGANALLPAIVEAARPDGCRMVHISSAAVQGRCKLLDETWDSSPFSPYSTSKAWAEELLRGADEVVVYRPTSVHGAGRPVTRKLVRLLSSRLASVAGAGERPTPQVLIDNVADAIAEVTLTRQRPPALILHPSEGLTTSELVRLVGKREPVHLPLVVARALVAFARLGGRVSGRASGTARRVEMLWFGQAQSTSWLDGIWVAPVGRDGWKGLNP